MHGYIDSIQIPLHLPLSAFKPSISTAPSSSNNGKGKAKATSQDGQYDVVANWNANDTSQVEKMVRMASLRSLSSLSLSLSLSFSTRLTHENLDGISISRLLYTVAQYIYTSNF